MATEKKKGIGGLFGFLSRSAADSQASTSKNSSAQAAEAGKRHRVTGTQYYETNTMTLAVENPNYALSKTAIIKRGFVGKTIYKYSFPTGPAALEQEPDNPHDPNAIKVSVAGQHVGYIKAGSCAHLNKVINEGRIEQISCRIYGGPYKRVNDYNYDPDSKPVYELESGTTPIKIDLTIIETKPTK